MTSRSGRCALARRLVAASLAACFATAAVIPRASADPPAAVDPWFGRDKALHVAATTLIAGGGYGASALFADDLAARAAFGAALALGAGIAKEAFDAAGFGSPSVRDFTWDIVGTTVGVSVSVSIDIALRGASKPGRGR